MQQQQHPSSHSSGRAAGEPPPIPAPLATVPRDSIWDQEEDELDGMLAEKGGSLKRYARSRRDYSTPMRINQRQRLVCTALVILGVGAVLVLAVRSGDRGAEPLIVAPQTGGGVQAVDPVVGPATSRPPMVAVAPNNETDPRRPRGNACAVTPPSALALCEPLSGAMTVRAPPTYDVEFSTSVGAFVLRVPRAWSPHGADRLYNLVRDDVSAALSIL
jgi:hypothetical protein